MPAFSAQPLSSQTGFRRTSHKPQAPAPPTSLRYTVGAVDKTHSDSGTFEDLAIPRFASLYRFACWLTQDRTAAEDLVQETFMKALKGFASFQQGTNFHAWIYRILRNTFLTSKAGLRAHVSLDAEDAAPLEPLTAATPETNLLARLDSETIQNALMELPLHLREVILLCDLEEMSYREIATAMGIPIGTVMSRLARARKAMRSLLAEKIQGEPR